MYVESPKSRLSEGERGCRLKGSGQPSTRQCRADDAFKARRSHLRSPPSVALKHTTAGPRFHEDFGALPVKRKRRVPSTPRGFAQSCSRGRVRTLLTWRRAGGRKRLQTRRVCPACPGVTCASRGSLARSVVSVDAHGPSGARYSKRDDSIYTAVFRGIPYFLTLVCQTRSCEQISGPRIKGFCPCRSHRYLKSLQFFCFFFFCFPINRN